MPSGEAFFLRILAHADGANLRVQITAQDHSPYKILLNIFILLLLLEQSFNVQLYVS